MTTTLTATSTAGVAPSPAIRPVTWIGRLRQAIGDIRTVTCGTSCVRAANRT